jgi:2-oxoisovalerate dehydrogenase E1 component alpha subunit
LDDLKRLILSKNPFHDQVLQKSDLLRHSKTKFHDMPTQMNTNTLLRAHRQMIRLRAMDYILLNAQRQGRISFYMTCSGEEAIHVGSASALKSQDVVLAQYREAGILMWRGFTLEQFTNQCFSNDLDLGRGR